VSPECVHCGAPMREPRGEVLLKGLLGLASAGMAAITLMACYGMPPCEEPAPDGGADPYHCYDVDLPEEDAGVTDAGTQPGDGGTDAGL
jgi:hypothetical protein